MNLSLYKLRKRLNNSGQGSLVAVALGGIVLSTLVASATSWYLTMRNNLGNTEEKLEAQTIAQSEWERLSHMSLDELEANRNNFKTPYSAGTGSQYSISVNLGEKGTFNNGTCGGVSGGYANCFKDTTITVYRDGNRMFTTRTLPLMAGDYTRKEIDDKLAAMKNDYINRDNALKNDYVNRDNSLKNDYTSKYNTLANRLNGSEFIKNKTPNYDLNLRYEKKADDDTTSIHAYIGNTEVPLASLGGGGAWGTPIAIAGKAPTENHVGWYGPSSGTLSANEWTAYTFVAQYSGLLLTTSINGECVKVNGVNSIGHVMSRDYGAGPITTTVPVNKGDVISIWGGNWAYLVPFK